MKGKDCDAMPPTVATRFRVSLSSLEHVEAEVAIVFSLVKNLSEKLLRLGAERLIDERGE